MPKRVAGVAQLKGWLPASVTLDRVEPLVEWVNPGSARFEEPFFDQTIARARESDPDFEEAVTGLDAFEGCEQLFDALKPTAFIYHMSRCGSTLVSNLLRALEGAIVIAEADPVSTLLSPYSPELWPYSREQWQCRRRALLGGAISALGQRRSPGDRYYFIKFTSWNVLALGFIESVWQDVPWVFVYRNPVEVMMSNLEKNSGWMQMKSIPETASRLLGWEAGEIARMTREEYCARVIGRFCDAVVARRSGNGSLLNYENISTRTLRDLLKKIDIAPNNSEVARMEKALRVYAKDPEQARPFVGDSESKRSAATEAVNEAAKRWAFPAYARLNRLAMKLPG